MQDLNIQAGEFIKAKRLVKGWTQDQLAKKVFGAKAGRCRISIIEKGKEIKLETLQKILIALDSYIEFKEN
ncbi:MAG: helix-turn-helix transcriptional regulator [Flavobacterium sp.]|nr:helix-turn-helix transcriptional regulator [Flavobacterium sp.]